MITLTRQELIERMRKWARISKSRDAYIRAGLKAGMGNHAIATEMQVSHGVVEKVRAQMESQLP